MEWLKSLSESIFGFGRSDLENQKRCKHKARGHDFIVAWLAGAGTHFGLGNASFDRIGATFYMLECSSSTS